MINKILHTIKCHHMIAPSDKIVIALSGGADSMALAFFLRQMKAQWNLSLEVVHLNHGLRGADAIADSQFVAQWCKENEMPCHIFERDIATLAKERGISTELAGRQARYELFASFGEQCKIATAHHLNDSIETVLLNLTRGTSLDGVTGIPPVRGNIIRPLIDCSRGEIEAFCEQHQIGFCTDATNAQIVFARNKIRQLVVPALRQINPSLEGSFSRFMAGATQDAVLLKELAEQAYLDCNEAMSLNCEKLLKLAPSIRSRVLRLYLATFYLNPPHNAVFAMEQLVFNGGSMQLTKTLYFKKSKNHIFSFSPMQSTSFQCKIINKLVMKHEEFLNISENDKNAFDFFADYDKIEGSIAVRQRLAGDKLTLSRRGCTKTLKKYFNELAIPQGERNLVPVLIDEQGVIGVAGYDCDRRVCIDDQTTRVVLLKVGGLNG